MISLINEAMVRLRDELDMRQAGDDASNVVQFKRPVVVSGDRVPSSNSPERGFS
jgi:hypothetical protein